MLHHLTFGRNWSNDRDAHDYVTDLDWELYCSEVLDSHFDGYTVYDAMGTWKSQPEDTKVVLIDTDNTKAINDVATLYKDMFNQDAVGHFTTPSMEFI